MSRRDKLENLIKELSARYLEEESNRASLITVSSCMVSLDEKRATIFVTVLPEEKESAALGFLKRQRSGLREMLKKKLSIKTVPFIDIEIDRGEKNRRKIDELLRGK